MCFSHRLLLSHVFEEAHHQLCSRCPEKRLDFATTAKISDLLMSCCSCSRGVAMKVTWKGPRPSQAFVLRGSFFPPFWFLFCGSGARKVWPFSGPTGSVTADQNLTGGGLFLASFFGTTILSFSGSRKGAAVTFCLAADVAYTF